MGTFINFVRSFLNESGLNLNTWLEALILSLFDPLKKSVCFLMGSPQCLDAKEASCLCLLILVKSTTVFLHGPPTRGHVEEPKEEMTSEIIVTCSLV